MRTLLILLTFLFVSCSVQQSVTNRFIYTVTWCTEKTVYLKDYWGHETKIKNPDKQLFFVGDSLILRDEFQTIYTFRP